MLRRLILLILLSATGWGACSSDDEDSNPTQGPGSPNQTALTQFESCEELESYLEEIALQETTNIMGGDIYWGLPEAGIPRDVNLSDDDDAAEGGSDNDGPPSPTTDGEDEGKDPEFTDTNNQEGGVDEADIVKTDGAYLYILTGGYLSIVEATPPEALALVAGVEIEGSPLEMFVKGDTSVIFSVTGGGWGPMPMDADSGVDRDDSMPPDDYTYTYTPPRLKVTVLDLSDRTAPTVARETSFEGDYQSSRRVGSRVHLVLNSYLQGPALEYYPVFEEPPYPELEDCMRPFNEIWEHCDYYEGVDDDDWAEGDKPDPATGVEGEANSGGSAGEDPTVIKPTPGPGPNGECDWSQYEMAFQAFQNSPEYQACNDRNNALLVPWYAEHDQRYEEAYEAMVERNRAKIEAATLEDWLPEMEDDGETRFLLDCGRFYRPDFSSGRGVISVMTLDIDQLEGGWNGSAVVANPGIVYASADALYISSYAYNYWMWYAEFSEPPAEVSRIHKFDITGDIAQYAASGEVPGQPLNQFAFSEYEGALRVATHTQPVWRGDVDSGGGDGDVPVSDPAEGEVKPDGTTTAGHVSLAAVDFDDTVPNNHLVVLKQVGDDLEEVGRISDIAPGETIYSARFLGEKGFMVTFLQIDPLFTFDLSDPTNPTRVGELKVPGFSTYLHDIGNDRLLAIGEAMDEEGTWRQGLQLSIFDVSAFDQPRLEHKLIIGEGYSEASYNHKAFTYFASKGVLAIPLSTYGAISWAPDGTPIENGDYFTGAAVYDISIAGGISERGRIDHTDFLVGDDAWWYGNAVRRAVMIDEAIYTISDLGVKANDLTALDETLGKVALPHAPPPPYYGGCYDDACWEGEKPPVMDEP